MDRTWGVPGHHEAQQALAAQLASATPNSWKLQVESSSQLVTLSKKSPHPIVHPITSSHSRREKAGERVPVYLVMSS